MKETTLQIYKERMLKVLVHIQDHLDEDLPLHQLATLAHFSPYHFHRIFRGMIGESVKGHIRRLRLERAAMRLKSGTQPVTTIAFDAGYETHEAFTRAFKALSGMSPSRFRETKGALSFNNTPSGVHYQEGGTLQNYHLIASGGNELKAEIKTVEPIRVAFMRHIGPYDQCGDTWGKLCAWLGSQGLLGPGVRFIGVCHDDPEVTPPENIRYDACIVVDESFTPQGEVGVQTIQGGEYAMATHEGPYQRLGETYAQLCGQWIPTNGREHRSAPCFEVYLNDPESTDPADLLTDVHVPLEPKKRS